MAVSRRYNNVTLYVNAFVCTLYMLFIFFEHFFPFIRLIFSVLALAAFTYSLLDFFHMYQFVFKCAHVFALWNIIQNKKNKKSLARRFFSQFFVVVLDFCFRVYYFFCLHAYTLNMIAVASVWLLASLDMCYLCRGAFFLLFFPFFIRSISFISLFPLWNKSQNDSKEQVAFGWRSKQIG